MSYKKEIKLVPVTEENAADSGRIIFASWGETYRGLMPDEILDGRSLDRCIQMAHTNMQNRQLCYVDGEAAGTIVIGPQARAFCTCRDSGEIVALYVLKKYQLMGIGKALMQWGIGNLGKDIATLFVLKGNDNAIDFYQILGFQFTGKELQDRGLTELEMILKIEMNLKRVTDRIWVYPFEAERDRPILGYVKGDDWSLAVDAGHSRAHTLEFYAALEQENLPLPSVTVLTHWHWDHSFGLHAIHGKSIANGRTLQHLLEFKETHLQNGAEAFLALDESIRIEYADLKQNPIVVNMPDTVFSGELLLDAGNCPIRLFQAESPHTDDSTLIVVENEKVLFLGDAAGGTFPTWEKDPALCRKLADTIAGLDVEICLESHHALQTKQEMLDNLKSIYENKE